MSSCSVFDPITQLKEKGMSIHSGNNPPNIEGTYIMFPCQLLEYDFKKDANVTVLISPDVKEKRLTFSYKKNEKGNMIISYSEESISKGKDFRDPSSRDSTFKYESENVKINGSGDLFTAIIRINQPYYGHIIVISGEKTNDGIKNIRYGTKIPNAYRRVVPGKSGASFYSGIRIYKDGDELAEDPIAKQEKLAAEKERLERESRERLEREKIQSELRPKLMEAERIDSEGVTNVNWNSGDLRPKRQEGHIIRGRTRGSGNQWVYEDRRTGKIAIPGYYEYAFDFANGVAGVRINNEINLIDKSGKIIVSSKYQLMQAANYVYACPCHRIPVGLQNKWGFVDSTGKEIIPLKYDKVICFYEGLAQVKLNDKWGFIDSTGKEITPIKYNTVGHFKDGRIRDGRFKGEYTIVTLNGKHGLVNRTGKEITPIKYDDISYWYYELALVRLNNKWGIIDKNGKEIVSPKYDDIGNFDENGIARVQNKFYGLINKSGKEILPTKYDNVALFSDGMAAVQQDGRWGFVNTSGQIVIPIKYASVECFDRGYARVRLPGIGQQWHYINKSGQTRR